MVKQKLKSNTYWTKRMEQKSIYFENKGNTIFKTIENGYKDLFIQYQDIIALFYAKYGTVKGNKLSVTYDAAIKSLSPSDTNKFLKKLDSVIISSKDQALLYKVKNLKRRKKISRLDKVLFDTEYDLSLFKDEQDRIMTSYMAATYSESHLLSVYEIQKALGGIYATGRLGEARIKQAMLYPWSGENYSDRIWKDKDLVAKRAGEIITRGMVEQKTRRQMAKELASTTNSSAKNALRLIRGETSHIVETTMKDACKDAGVTTMEISSIRDQRGVHYPVYDGVQFKLGSADEAFLTPPIEFPNCRCTLMGVFTEDIANKQVEGEFPSFDEWGTDL